MINTNSCMSSSTALYAQCLDELWSISGMIPIEFCLHENDLTSSKIINPIYLLASRYTYLPIVAEDVIKYFQEIAIEFSSDVWFEYNGIPLKSHLPIGVLYDLFCYSSIYCHGKYNNDSTNMSRSQLSPSLKDSPPWSSSSSSSSTSNSIKIWKIYIRFQNFPIQILIKCNKIDCIEKYYFHSLKQALYVVHNSTRIFNELSITQQKLLWLSIKSCNQNLYRQVLTQSNFIPTSSSSSSSSALSVLATNDVTIDTVSDKVIMNTNSKNDVDEGGAVEDHHSKDSTIFSLPIRVLQYDKPTLQRPVHINKHDLFLKTLRAVLIDDFTLLRIDDNHRHVYGDVRFVIHGVEVNLDAPIYNLWSLMCHCDLWLYVIIVTLP